MKLDPHLQFSPHPAATIFPMMDENELQELADDVRANGLRQPIVILGKDADEYLIVDGRNRFEACKRAGVEPDFVKLDPEVDPVAYVVSLNLHRRHLSESQRGMVAARIATLPKGSNQHAPIGAPKTQEEAADLMGVGRRTVQRAREVIQEGVPALVQAVDEGKLAVSVAAQIATRSKEEQEKLLEAFDQGVITDAAKKIRSRKHEAAREQLRAQLEDIAARKEKAIAGVYDVVVIDPPWKVEKVPYPTMTEEGIRERKPPCADDCQVFLWTTQGFLPMAFRLLDAWGLKYVCTFVWHKPGGQQPTGLPQYNCEFVLYATKGSPRFIEWTAFQTCFEAPRGEHSEKPEEFYATLRRVTAGRRFDMYNRRQIEGFEGWGYEAPEAETSSPTGFEGEEPAEFEAAPMRRAS
jgi:N6-adenosine-specific RNA methylase IME4